MPPSDLTQILLDMQKSQHRALQEMAAQQQKSVLEMHQSNQEILIANQEVLLAIKAETVATRAAIENMETNVLGEGGRIPQLEERVKSNETWTKAGHLIAPFIVGMHALLRYFGLK